MTQTNETQNEVTVYKLTREDYTTYNNTKWGENVTHTASGIGEMCSKRWLHAYEHPLLAILLAPIHVGFMEKSILWEAKGIIGKNDGLKLGLTKLTTIKIIDKPKITVEQRIRFGILCALEVYKKENFVKWANYWLDNKDRSVAAAHAAKAAATAAAYAAANAANAAYGDGDDAVAVDAATAAYAAANAAANASYVVAVDAATAAAYAVHVAVDAATAAYAAANAAYAAANAAANKKINLIEIAEKVCAN